jgi:hypothetical protein
LRVQELEAKLEEARTKFETARREGTAERLKFEAIKQDQEGRLDEKLKYEMLDYGSHVPTTIPMEFSKFSGKVLDVRERQRKSAWFRQYDEAEALRKEALEKEKNELKVLTGRFAKSYKKQKQEVVRKQENRKGVFGQHWQYKKDQTDQVIAKRLADLRKAVEHWERDLAEEEGVTVKELRRIKGNERCNSIPIEARQAASHKRF